MGAKKCTCRYYNDHMHTLLTYFKALYQLEGCGAGGLLHVVLDDFNYNLHCIEHCMTDCIKHSEVREEARLGFLICNELMKLTTVERSLLFNLWEGREFVCFNKPSSKCKQCPVFDDMYEEYAEMDKRFKEQRLAEIS